VNWTLIFGLVLLFRYTPLEIEWLGLAVLGLCGVIYFQLLKHRPRPRLDPTVPIPFTAPHERPKTPK
jgi:hypothetical protein